MASLSFWPKPSLLVLCLVAFNAKICLAQLFPKDPAKWWPDPSTGLMWAEHGYSGTSKSIIHPHGRTWQQSVDYCAALRLGGFSGWRLPSLDEVKGIAYTRHGVQITSGHGSSLRQDVDPKSICVSTLTTSDPFDQRTIKVGEWNDDPFPFATFVWTSTPTPDAEKPAPWIAGPTIWIVGPELLFGGIPKTSDMYHGNYMASLCVRPMEPELLQIAKDAQVNVPVPNVQELGVYVPLNKARLAYEAGQYRDSIAQAQNAIALDPHLLTAYWAIGISYGMLGEWDPAIASLNTAYKLDKHNGDVYAALEWAKASNKAFKKGEKPKIKGRDWFPEWNAPWS